jgi:hypothetical protein
MAVFSGPEMVEEGLVLCLDAGNPRSYPGSGTTWFDLSGRGNHFNIYNSPQFTNSRFIFDGLDEYMQSANTLDLSQTNKVTVQYLFRVLSYTTVKVLFEISGNFNSNANSFGSFYADTTAQDQIPMGIKASGGYNYNLYDKSLYNDLGWKFCNWVMDRSITSGTQNLFYTQGVFRTGTNSLTSIGSENFVNDYFYIATRGNNLGQFNANIELSHFTIYNRALSSTEIQQNFNALRGRFGI